jgi:hypothetical protein
MTGTAMNAMIDTHALIKMMQEAGIKEPHAEAITKAITASGEAGRENLVTIHHHDISISRLELSLQKTMNEAKMQFIQWAIGSQITLLLAVVALANFTKLL